MKRLDSTNDAVRRLGSIEGPVNALQGNARAGITRASDGTESTPHNTTTTQLPCGKFPLGMCAVRGMTAAAMPVSQPGHKHEQLSQSRHSKANACQQDQRARKPSRNGRLRPQVGAGRIRPCGGERGVGPVCGRRARKRFRGRSRPVCHQPCRPGAHPGRGAGRTGLWPPPVHQHEAVTVPSAYFLASRDAARRGCASISGCFAVLRSSLTFRSLSIGPIVRPASDGTWRTGRSSPCSAGCLGKGSRGWPMELHLYGD